MPSARDLSTMRAVHAILSPINAVTEELCAEKYITRLAATECPDISRTLRREVEAQLEEKLGRKPSLDRNLTYTQVVASQVGIGRSDGANAVIGKRNSVYSRLKEEVRGQGDSPAPAYSVFVPLLAQGRFGRGRRDTCGPGVPRQRDQELVREEPLKLLQYRDLFGAINNGALPANLVQLSATRWLAWSRAIDVVLAQWLELRTHFGIIAGSLKARDKCTVGRKPCELFKTDDHKLYLLFLQPITKALNQLNLKFQATDAEVPVLVSELHEMCINVARMFLDPKVVPRLDAGGTSDTAVMSDDAVAGLERALSNPQARLPFKRVNHGEPFRIELGRMQIKPDVLNVIENSLLDYIIEFVLSHGLISVTSISDQMQKVSSLAQMI
ncbi:Pathogenesis-related protein 1 [Frankliniella fusca]|uniref:Pathogenesis-related protein 1 n=1 Tax=Frankliniella fusca TaxID=407009 RepID=A0AAE1LPK4_9NEOP|nr:Pathogenesis-related protein 1 [Frankliniella fusca]